MFALLLSTAIPTVLANWGVNFAALISCRVNPLPYLILPAYFLVGQWIMGLSFSSGRGKMAAALAALALNLAYLRAG